MEVEECPLCGAPVSPSNRACDYCKAPLYIGSISQIPAGIENVGKYLKQYKKRTAENPSSVEGLFGLGICYLRMGNFDFAQRTLEDAIAVDPSESQVFYYYALACTKGKRIGALCLHEVRKIEEALFSAIALEDKAHYKLFWAVIRREYYEANGMRISGSKSDMILLDIKGKQIDFPECDFLWDVVKVRNIDFYVSKLS